MSTYKFKYNKKKQILTLDNPTDDILLNTLTNNFLNLALIDRKKANRILGKKKKNTKKQEIDKLG